MFTSSAKWGTELRAIALFMPFMYIKNKKGYGIDLCGAPWKIIWLSELQPLMNMH